MEQRKEIERMTEGGSSTETEQLNLNCFFSVVKVKWELCFHVKYQLPEVMQEPLRPYNSSVIPVFVIGEWQRTARIAKANATASLHLAIKKQIN